MSGGLGVVCVRNRTQEEVQKGISFEEVVEKERLVLEESDLAQIPDRCKGIQNLIEQLITL